MNNHEAAELITQVYEREIKNTFLLMVKDEVMLKIDEAFNMAISALESIEQIRTEIEEHTDEKYGMSALGCGIALQIIDKYAKGVTE